MFLIYRSPFVNAANSGPLVNVVTLVLEILAILSVITRIATKLLLGRRLAAEDYLILSALVSGPNHYVHFFMNV